MENIDYMGQQIGFWTLTGEVLSSQRHVKTHMVASGGGGGGHISAQTGGTINIDPIRMNSYNTITNEIWLRLDNGLEEDIRINGDMTLPRQGQRLTFLYGKKSSETTGFLIACVNHHAQSHVLYVANQKDAIEFLKLCKLDQKAKLAPKPEFMMYVLKLLSPVILVWLIFGMGIIKQLTAMQVSTLWILMAGGPTIFWFYIRKWKVDSTNRKSLAAKDENDRAWYSNKFSPHIQKLLQEIYRTEGQPAVA